MTITIEEALAAVRAAFPEHPLDSSGAFRDWGTTYTSASEFKDGTRDRTWTELPAKFLEWHHDAPLYLGPLAIADFLPAYISVVLRDEPGLSALPGFLFGALTRQDAHAKRFDARFAALTDEQRRAVRAALLALEAKWRGSHRQEEVRRALDSYWRTL